MEKCAHSLNILTVLSERQIYQLKLIKILFLHRQRTGNIEGGLSNEDMLWPDGERFIGNIFGLA